MGAKKLSCVLWWCSSFLPHEEDEELPPLTTDDVDPSYPKLTDSYYKVLNLSQAASTEEIKKAYKKRSLQLHPDKLAQRGKVLTDADRQAFLRIKESYDTLSDPTSRGLYDTLVSNHHTGSIQPPL